MTNYHDKKKQLFDILDAEEKKLEGSCLRQNAIPNNHNKRSRPRASNSPRDESIERYKQKESIFKRPELPINKCLAVRHRPDYERNPQKYQHYSLSDVSDTSDRMNSSAAFAFLREMEERKRIEEQDNEGSAASSKIVFKNSAKLKPKEDTEEKEKRIQGNKFVMKEYVVGEKRQKSHREKSKNKTADSAKQLRLSHLNDDEEDDE